MPALNRQEKMNLFPPKDVHHDGPAPDHPGTVTRATSKSSML
jgi:hypothetical protein